VQDDSSHSRLLPASPAVAESEDGTADEQGEGGGFRCCDGWSNRHRAIGGIGPRCIRS
jgi:hypothetical protein